MGECDRVESSSSQLSIHSCGIDMFSPINLERFCDFSAALCNIEPFIGERAAHAAKHAAISKVPDGSLHHAPGRGSRKKNRLFCSEQCLKPRVNRAVKIPKILAAMADHRTRKGRPRFFRYFDGTRNEKLVVRDHRQRSTLNAQHSTSNLYRRSPAWVARAVSRAGRRVSRRRTFPE